MSDLRRRFADDGYLVLESVLEADVCGELFAEVIRSFSTSKPSYVHEADYRLSCPAELTQTAGWAISQCVTRAYDAIDATLTGKKSLVELGSITVFPGATFQPPHRDVSDPAKNIVTLFMNLVPTREGVGALELLPGSHLPADPAGGPKLLELPLGSAVFLNGKITHRGTENRSVDRIRPVFYCSFGDDDAPQMPYSIRDEYKARYQLSDFNEQSAT